MAETSSLLNCRTRKGTAGSNPASSTLFLVGLFDLENLQDLKSNINKNSGSGAAR